MSLMIGGRVDVAQGLLWAIIICVGLMFVLLTACGFLSTLSPRDRKTTEPKRPGSSGLLGWRVVLNTYVVLSMPTVNRLMQQIASTR
jgi:hypothetical protein